MESEKRASRRAGGGEEVAGRKQAEEQLRRSESLYRLLADNASDVIWTLGMDMRLTYISPSVKVNSALQAAGKAAGVTGQMLIYLGHSFEKRGRLDLSAFFRAAVPAFRASLPDNVTLETEIPSVLPAITANPAEL